MAENNTKVYEEGNNGLYIFSKTSDKEYSAEPVHIKGMISLEGTVEQTENKLAADDETDYLVRRSPATITGTLTLVGLSYNDYVTLYGSGVKDKNGALIYGASGEPNKVGLVFFNKAHKIVNGVDTVGAKAHIFYNVTFSLPSISTTTIAEDDTTIRPFELSFTASPINFGTAGTATYIPIEEKDEATTSIWEKHFATYGAPSPSITMYVPDEEIE